MKSSDFSDQFVHSFEDQRSQIIMKADQAAVLVADEYIYKQETHLTVFKTSLFFQNDGFTVYNCRGELVFRVDSYGPDTRDKVELVLMDAHGKCLLTVRRKVQFQLMVFFDFSLLVFMGIDFLILIFLFVCTEFTQ